jgi:hypothetical protein
MKLKCGFVPVQSDTWVFFLRLLCYFLYLLQFSVNIQVCNKKMTVFVK